MYYRSEMDPESFLKLLEKFLDDLTNVFAGNSKILDMLNKQKRYITLCKENLSLEEIVKRHFDKMVEYEDMIIKADESVLCGSSESIYLLKYVDFCLLWNASEMTQKNKETTMRYLQTLLTVGKINQNGGMESIQDLVSQMQSNVNNFKPIENVDTTKGTNILSRLMDDIGKDMEGIDLGIDESNIDPNNVDVGGIVQQLMSGGKSQDIMSVVTNLATKLQQQVESGDVSQDELAAAAQNMMAGMGGGVGGGMNMGALMQMMMGNQGVAPSSSRSSNSYSQRRQERGNLDQVPESEGVVSSSSSSSSSSGKRGKGGKRK